jgi:hypothetical protein
MIKVKSKLLIGLGVSSTLLFVVSACSINIGPDKPAATVTVTAAPSDSPTEEPTTDEGAFQVPSDLRVNDHAEQTAFTTPSGNITCAYFVFDGPAELRCDVTNHSWKAPPPNQSCDLDWGSSITLTTEPNFGCVGDSVFGTSARGSDATWWWGQSSADTSIRVYGQVVRTLPVGSGIQRAPFQCVSITGGVDCRNMNSGGRFIVTETDYSFTPGN